MVTISRKTVHKLGIQRNIKSSVDTHFESLEEGLEKQLFSQGVPDDLSVGDVATAVADVLVAIFDRFEVADRNVSSHVAQERLWRAFKDEAVEKLRQVLIGTRSVIKGVWGDEGRRHVGFVGKTPESPHQLVVYARNVHEKLDAGLDDMDTLLGQPPPDLAEYISVLDASIEELDEAIDTLQSCVRKTEDARAERNKIGEEWDEYYVPVATTVEQLFRLAGRPEMAEKVRPTSRRRSGLSEEEDIKRIEEDPGLDITVDDADDDDPSESTEPEDDVVIIP